MIYKSKRERIEDELEQVREQLLNCASVASYDRQKLKIEYLNKLLQRYQAN